MNVWRKRYAVVRRRARRPLALLLSLALAIGMQVPHRLDSSAASLESTSAERWLTVDNVNDTDDCERTIECSLSTSSSSAGALGLPRAVFTLAASEVSGWARAAHDTASVGLLRNHRFPRGPPVA